MLFPYPNANFLRASLLSAKRPEESAGTHRREKGVEGRGAWGWGAGRHAKEGAKGILKKRKVSSWAMSKDKSEVHRGSLTQSSPSLSSLPCSLCPQSPPPSHLLCVSPSQPPEITNAPNQELVLCVQRSPILYKFNSYSDFRT